MAADTKGTGHIFGLKSDQITDATIVSITCNEEFGLSEETTDGNGVVIETRKDNRIKRATVTLRFRANYASPNIGSIMALSNLADNSFDGNYEIDSKGQEYRSGAHAEQSFELVKYEGITYP